MSNKMIAISSEQTEEIIGELQTIQYEIIANLKEIDIQTLQKTLKELKNFNTDEMRKRITDAEFEIGLERFLKKRETAEMLKVEIEMINSQNIKIIENQFEKIEEKIQKVNKNTLINEIQKTKKNQTLLVSVFASIVSVLTTALIFTFFK